MPTIYLDTRLLNSRSQCSYICQAAYVRYGRGSAEQGNNGILRMATDDRHRHACRVYTVQLAKECTGSHDVQCGNTHYPSSVICAFLKHYIFITYPVLHKTTDLSSIVFLIKEKNKKAIFTDRLIKIPTTDDAIQVC